MGNPDKGFASLKKVTLFAVGCLLSLECGTIERSKQLHTQARLHNVIAAIRELVHENGRLPSSEQLKRRVGEKMWGDGWGREFEYGSFIKDGEEYYVAASLGRDGIRDVDQLSDYIGSPKESVQGSFDRDIVAVNGRFVRDAGK